MSVALRCYWAALSLTVGFVSMALGGPALWLLATACGWIVSVVVDES